MTDSSPAIILGAGGHAKVLIDVLRLSGREIIGVVAPELKLGSQYCGELVLGDDDVVFDYDPYEIELVNGLGALPGKMVRWNRASTMREKGYTFATVIHPSTTISSEVAIGGGAQVMAGCVIQPGSAIGRDTIINTGVMIDHDCIIEESCHVAPGVVCSGGVKIGRNSHIGTGVKIIQNIIVGDLCVVAAGTTLYQDVESGVMVRQQMKMIIKKYKA
jgi:sugar O-acyltransferase (sialic acid O-acetyltransferase NeuD family)